MSDLVEAGILDIEGVSATGAILLQVGSEGGGVDWRDIFKRYLNFVGNEEGVTFLYKENWTRAEWNVILTAAEELEDWNTSIRDREGHFKDE